MNEVIDNLNNGVYANDVDVDDTQYLNLCNPYAQPKTWEYRKEHRNLADIPFTESSYKEGFCRGSVIHHFAVDEKELQSPAKTIFVAICYAMWLGIIYRKRPVIFLMDKDLLVDDKYYVPYDPIYKVNFINPELKDYTQDAYKWVMAYSFEGLFRDFNVTTVGATLKYFIKEFDISILECMEILDYMKKQDGPMYNVITRYKKLKTQEMGA